MASFWSLPKLFFLRRELAQRAGQFRKSCCGSCTYLRDCLPLRCELTQRAGQFRTFDCGACTYLRDCLQLPFEVAQHAGQFRTSVRPLCHRVWQSPSYLQGFSASRLQALPACRAVSDICLRIPQLSAAFLGITVTSVTGMPGSFGLCFGFYAIG